MNTVARVAGHVAVGVVAAIGISAIRASLSSIETSSQQHERTKAFNNRYPFLVHDSDLHYLCCCLRDFEMYAPRHINDFLNTCNRLCMMCSAFASVLTGNDLTSTEQKNCAGLAAEFPRKIHRVAEDAKDHLSQVQTKLMQANQEHAAEINTLVEAFTKAFERLSHAVYVDAELFVKNN